MTTPALTHGQALAQLRAAAARVRALGIQLSRPAVASSPSRHWSEMENLDDEPEGQAGRDGEPT